MDPWCKILKGDLESTYFKFAVNLLSYIIVILILVIRLVTDEGEGISLYYYIYHTYVITSILPVIFFISNPVYWKAAIGKAFKFPILIQIKFIFGSKFDIYREKSTAKWRNKMKSPLCNVHFHSHVWV